MAGKRGRPRKHPAQEVKEEIKKILFKFSVLNMLLLFKLELIPFSCAGAW